MRAAADAAKGTQVTAYGSGTTVRVTIPGGGLSTTGSAPPTGSGGRRKANRSQRAPIRSEARSTPSSASEGRVPNASVVRTETSCPKRRRYFAIASQRFPPTDGIGGGGGGGRRSRRAPGGRERAGPRPRGAPPPRPPPAEAPGGAPPPPPP